MSTAERARPLAGLVSPAAENLYLRLRACGPTRVDITSDDVDLRAPETRELLDLGLAIRAKKENKIVPVEPSVALRMLIEQRHAELVNAQQRIMDAWGSLTNLLSNEPVRTGRASLDGVLSLSTYPDVMARAAVLYPAAQRRVRAVTTGELTPWPAKAASATRRRVTIVGPRSQLIYQVHCLDTMDGNRLLEEAGRRGAEVRVRSEVPIQMLHVDDTIALISMDRTAQSALLVRKPAIIGMLGEWFDLLWEHPATMAPNGGDGDILSIGQRRVLELMAANGDEAIARRLAMSITTVRRHVKGIYQALGVDNRFAAGVAAAKRGWI
jgi:DNA-binding CsgD family transcriptional regulator